MLEPGYTPSKSLKKESQNIVGALEDLTLFMMDPMLLYGESSAYLKKVMNAFPDDLESQRSFALRLIIHYVGDIHQPLHSVALVDSEYPSGDEGGNREKIPSVDGVSDLHFVWDSVVYEYTGRPELVSIIIHQL